MKLEERETIFFFLQIRATKDEDENSVPDLSCPRLLLVFVLLLGSKAFYLEK